jgi:hypothetical protein
MKEYHNINSNIQLWQESYFTKTANNHRAMMNEIEKQSEEIQLMK